MLVLLVIVVLIILSLMFGGFQKGTKSGGLGPLAPVVHSRALLQRTLIRSGRAPWMPRPAQRLMQGGYWRVGKVCDSAGMTIFDDLAAEQERLEKILTGLDEAQWVSASAAEGWTIADVVLHLAQSEEAAAATATHGTLRGGLGVVAGETMDERADAAVRMERRHPPRCSPGGSGPGGGAGRDAGRRPGPAGAVDGRHDQAGHAGDDPAGRALGARPGHRRAARRRLARHAAAAAHRLAGAPHAAVRAERGGRAGRPVRCELTAPDGAEVWRFGPPDAESAITGAAGEFCRVAAQRLDPARSGLEASGPHGATALRLVRTYAA